MVVMEKVSSVDMGRNGVNANGRKVETGLGKIEELFGAVGEDAAKY
jgi:hypothetical protein